MYQRRLHEVSRAIVCNGLTGKENGSEYGT
jgi:hypothetical protein